jgi:hypothetical protein
MQRLRLSLRWSRSLLLRFGHNAVRGYMGLSPNCKHYCANARCRGVVLEALTSILRGILIEVIVNINSC